MTAATQPTPSSSDFLWRFGISAILVVAILGALAPVRDGLVSLTLWSVESSARLVQLDAWTGEDGLITFASSDGGAFSYRIVEECTATAVVGLFTVAVLAAPAVAWRRRAIGVIVGSAALLTANWVRLLSLAWLGVHRPAAFDLAHVWLWQIVSVALVVVAWLVWLRWATGQSDDSGTARQRTAWFAGTVVVFGGILQLAHVDQRYSDGIDSVVRGVQHALNTLPYRPISIVGSPDEWTVHVRSVSLVLAVALTAALTGPTVRTRLTSGLVAVPFVFAAHLMGTLLEASSNARLGFVGQMTIGRYVQIPLLVIVHGLPTLVPLVLWHRATMHSMSPTVATVQAATPEQA